MNLPNANVCHKLDLSLYVPCRTMQLWMECMAASYSDKVTLITIGKSSEGRPLQVLRLGSGSKSKPAVFIDGGIHAREWVSLNKPAHLTIVPECQIRYEKNKQRDGDTV